MASQSSGVVSEKGPHECIPRDVDDNVKAIEVLIQRVVELCELTGVDSVSGPTRDSSAELFRTRGSALDRLPVDIAERDVNPGFG